MPLLSAITTCKGRLEHLKITLPKLAVLPDCEVVVVDYDCPDGAGDWVRETFPAVKVISVTERPIFSQAVARNLGAAAASAPWLLLIDADVIVDPGLTEAVRDRLRDGVFLRPASGDRELIGTLVASRSDFNAIGGYDEVFAGWGSEDLDLMQRLEWLGRRAEWLPGHLVEPIKHSDVLRGQFHEIGDIWANVAVNALYRRAKVDLQRLGVELDLAQRRDVYERLRAASRAPGGLNRFELVIRKTDIAGRSWTTSLCYTPS